MTLWSLLAFRMTLVGTLIEQLTQAEEEHDFE